MNRVARRSPGPAQAWAALVVAYALLEWALWTTGRMNQIASLVFLAWVILTTILRRRKLQDLGLGRRGFAGASIAIVIALVVAGGILVAAHAAGSLRPLYGPQPMWRGLVYAGWALVQQFLLNSYFFLTLEELLPHSRDAAMGAVALFTLAHFPNPVLLAGTFLLSLVFVNIFRRYRNIYPLGIAHAILGLSLALAVPDFFLRHMRVGIGYYHFVIK